MKKILRKKSGVSLIIAIIFVSSLMLVMAGLFEAQIFTIKTLGNREQEGKARYLEEGVKELAGWYAANTGLGVNASDADQALEGIMGKIYTMADSMMNADLDPNAGQNDRFDCSNLDHDAQTNGRDDKCAWLEIKGRAGDQAEDLIPFNDGTGDRQYYSVPIANTGTAGVDCEKRELGPNDVNDANDACNWNQIKMGESVEIPLYYMNGAVVANNFVEANGQAPSQKFILRVRAPLCVDVKKANKGVADARACNDDARVGLYPTADNVADFLKVGTDKVLIQWTISDMNPGSEKTLLAMDSRDTITNKRSEVRKVDAFNKITEVNTEISASRIDSTVNNIVLEDKTDLAGKVNKEGKNLSGTATSIGQFIQSCTKPVLRLSMVDRPFIKPVGSDTEYNVPFLEYQLLTTTPVSDSKSLLTGSAKIGDFNKEFKTYSYRKQTAGGFVLESF